MQLEHERFEKMDAMATQVGGTHYREMKIQPTEFIHANGIGFIAGNVIKYICRHKLKNGRQDLEKAAHYLQMLIAMEYPDKPLTPADVATHKAENNNWIPWGGGKCPFGNSAHVVIKLRGGNIESHKSDDCDWFWNNDKYDIVAYRVVNP